MRIDVNGQQLDLPAGVAMEIEDTNPIFNELGSQSLPLTLPATSGNLRALKFPGRVDSNFDPARDAPAVVVSSGAYIRRGVLNVTSAGGTSGISVNVGFDNSAGYAAWSSKRLADLSTLRVVQGEDVGMENSVEGMLGYIRRLYESPNPERDPYAVFPVAVAKETATVNEKEQTFWEVLNVPDESGSFRQPDSVRRIVDGELTDVAVPYGYGLTVFLRVWRLLGLIFDDLGVVLDGNFERDTEFNRLVVLNNAADAVCTGVIREADLVPDCTVSEFLNALWVRFGLVYNIDYTARRAKLRFLRDILKEPAGLDLSALIAAPPVIEYGSPQYVKLSARTSLEGAAPAKERFEDFSKGMSLQGMHLGADVSEWTFIPSTGGTGGKWDGDVRDDLWNQPEPDPDFPEPDPGDDRDDRDDRDDGRSVLRARSGESASAPASFLVREYVTGNWYVVDEKNRKIKASGSGFFNWDPASEGLTACEVSSVDECVPVVRVSTVGSGTSHDFNDYAPAYLVGARHYHSYIVGIDEDDVSADTPLSFALAYPVGGKSVGRICPEGPDGERMKLDDGTTPELSLFFQFEDGLFAKFWKEYDEILRHGNQTVELDVAINLGDLNIDPLTPVSFFGSRGLIDTVNYTLPAGRVVPAALRFRTITTHGTYDIDAEQNIPHFAVAARRLEWALVADGFDNLDPTEIHIRAAAANQYKRETGYTSHGIVGDYYDVTAAGVSLISFTREAPGWTDDDTLPAPYGQGAKLMRIYKARAVFEVREVHDTSTQDDAGTVELSPEPIGQVSLTLSYTVDLIARWVLA